MDRNLYSGIVIGAIAYYLSGTAAAGAIGVLVLSLALLFVMAFVSIRFRVSFLTGRMGAAVHLLTSAAGLAAWMDAVFAYLLRIDCVLPLLPFRLLPPLAGALLIYNFFITISVGILYLMIKSVNK